MFLQVTPENNFWNAPAGSSELLINTILALVVGIGLIFALMAAPARLRRPIVAVGTFLGGLYWVLDFMWPSPVDRQPGELPRNAVESVGFWIKDANPVVSNFSNILSALLIGLGVYSLMRIHLRRLVKVQRDWFFSLVLLASLFSMVFVGYWDWTIRLNGGTQYDNPANWVFANRARDLLFEGLFQQMEAAMFSIIAFFILSAAYRAFRVRSIEATILLSAALVVILALMGAVEQLWNNAVNLLPGAEQGGIFANLKLTEIAGFLQNSVQTPSIRAIDFGVGIGAIAMALRLWLSLEKTGASTSG